ncbi:Pkinase-domain-containing protein [Xylona heveae TC161]|uniref:mitogen-activated protein kinase kinase kinase n=1 Tax=Xylona heveae (strain CBS 132557 / TC161) TaxID=1328760 RepID=A0A165GSG7_XYLHT|nr:Pkinase-domain-containing protein [Xylona heveae TC161]KZF22538.1 Pkinase-domain-containing protein [Xylona heveae TC161]
MGATNHEVFSSPTESEFSDSVYDGPDYVRNWDERRVGEWLRSINCPQYEQLFRGNHINGETLLECDQSVLKDLGIKKIGDRVRINVAIKALRKNIPSQKKRNRDSLATLENPAFTPSSSPRPLYATKERTHSSAGRGYTRGYDYSVSPAIPSSISRSPSRPSSPLADLESGRGLRAQRYGGMSPMESARREQAAGYFSYPSSASTTSGRRPATPGDAPQTARVAHGRQGSGVEGLTLGGLPPDKHVIRVIYSGGLTKVVKVQNCKTTDDIMRATLKKFGLPEHQTRNYCFYVLGGVTPDPSDCRRIPESELIRICSDLSRYERNRLILRKIHAGEPEDEELQVAAQLALEEAERNYAIAIANNSTRSQQKVQKLTGESWEAVKYPLSPASYPLPPALAAAERSRNVKSAAHELEKPRQLPEVTPRGRMIRQFFGQRPPSELISNDLVAYFPDHPKEEIDRTVRMSMRRSARLSRATNRLSVASNLSFVSSLKDAPPLPSIADTWLTGANQGQRPPRPLSVSRIALPQTAYRDSIASSSLEPLQEESPIEPNRKSYVSFDSAPDASSISVTDPEGHPGLQSYFDETGSSTPVTDAGGTGSFNEHLSQAIAEDGEEPDEELTRFLEGDAWENVKWMKGALIGQGSFGSVYLALHCITGELMAVKQVELPSNAGNQVDNKKKSMLSALKHEIGLLRELQHPNIVQYLGSSSDEQHLNIFLEYVPGGSVAAMLNQYGALHEPLIRNFVRQILNGLAYLHGRDIIHRDIKGANVLVDNKGGIKISDFGISKKVEASSLLSQNGQGHAHRPSLQGSVFWMAPEVVKQTSYTRKADIWSLGCLIVEMFTGTHPFPDCSQLQAIFKIGGGTASPTLPEEASDEGKEFLSRTFELDFEKRPSAEELLVSPFLNAMA